MKKALITGVTGQDGSYLSEFLLVEKRAAEAAKEPDTLLVFTQDTHKENYLDTAEGKKLPVPHCIKPQKGWEIAPSLTPYAKDAVVIEKPTFWMKRNTLF